MNNLIHKALCKIAKTSYATSVRAVNKVSDRGVYQSVEPKELKKLKRTH